MSEESTNKNFFQKTYDNLITSAAKMGLYKELLIIFLIFLIVLIASYDSILPLFIQMDIIYLNNLVSLIPLFVCIIIMTLAICSHFKIFGKDALFQFNHKIVNFNKYKKVIAEKIENYKNKLYKLQKLYNQKDLTRKQIKMNISNFNTKNKNLTEMTEKLFKECSDLNEQNDKLVNRFMTRTDNTIDNIKVKGTELFRRAREWRKIEYNKALERQAREANNIAAANKFEEQRKKAIQDEKAARKQRVQDERLRRLEAVKKAKATWVHNNTIRLQNQAKNEAVTFFKHRSHSVCAVQKPDQYWPDWGHKNRNQWCGHDEVSSITVPKYLILDVWQHTHKNGRHIRMYGAPNGSQHYNIHYFYARGMNDEISCSQTTTNHAKLNADIQRFKNTPLVRFGDLIVEGEYPPGINANSI